MKLLSMLLGSKPLLTSTVGSKLGFFGAKATPALFEAMRLKIPLPPRIPIPKISPASFEATQLKVPLPPPPIPIPKESMSSLKHWPDDGTFELGFATKSGLPVPFCPVDHSAIAFRNHADKTFSVYGRQSPWLISKWRRDGLDFRTRLSNELPFLSDGYTFTSHPTGAFFNKKEIKHCLDSADRVINEAQLCNMYQSNCYSYSTTVMGFAAEILLSRPHVDAKALGQLLRVLEERPLTDNFSIGVLNNKVVTDKLSSVCESVLKYTKTLAKPSLEEKELQATAERLLKRLPEASIEERGVLGM